MLTPIQFSLICAEAYSHGIPRGFERAVLREYLQCEIMSILAAHKGSESLAFIGGTGLRLLYDLDRFSEDLDFDYGGIQNDAPMKLFESVYAVMKERGYVVRWRMKNAAHDRGGALVIQEILFTLGLSPHPKETITIKFDYTTPRSMPPCEVRLLNRFGFVVQITTEPLPVLCARKVQALLTRPRLQPRDLYDLTWFFSRRILPEISILHQNNIVSFGELKARLYALFAAHASRMASYERDLMPLLLHPSHVQRIRLLPELVKTLFLE